MCWKSQESTKPSPKPGKHRRALPISTCVRPGKREHMIKLLPCLIGPLPAKVISRRNPDSPHLYFETEDTQELKPRGLPGCVTEGRLRAREGKVMAGISPLGHEVSRKPYKGSGGASVRFPHICNMGIILRCRPTLQGCCKGHSK